MKIHVREDSRHVGFFLAQKCVLLLSDVFLVYVYIIYTFILFFWEKIYHLFLYKRPDSN